MLEHCSGYDDQDQGGKWCGRHEPASGRLNGAAPSEFDPRGVPFLNTLDAALIASALQACLINEAHEPKVKPRWQSRKHQEQLS